jgi:uncharacterized protein DUF6496
VNQSGTGTGSAALTNWQRPQGGFMARRYSRAAGKDVKSAMHRRKKGTLKRGKSGHGGKVKSRKQALAIGLSEARKQGKKVPRKSSKRRTSRRKRR